MLGDERPECPGDVRADQGRDAKYVDGLAIATLAEDGQHRHAAKAGEDADPGGPRWSSAVRPQPVEQSHPERQHGDRERGQSRRHDLFGPDHAAVTAQQHQRAGDDGDVPLLPGRERAAAKFRPGDEDRAGENEAATGHEERRKGFNRDADGEIGRAPDEIDGAEAEDQPGGARPAGFGFAGWFAHVRGLRARRNHSGGRAGEWAKGRQQRDIGGRREVREVVFLHFTQAVRESRIHFMKAMKSKFFQSEVLGPGASRAAIFHPLPRLCGGEARVRGITQVARLNPPSPRPLPPQSRVERVQKSGRPRPITPNPAPHASPAPARSTKRGRPP